MYTWLDLQETSYGYSYGSLWSLAGLIHASGGGCPFHHLFFSGSVCSGPAQSRRHHPYHQQWWWSSPPSGCLGRSCTIETDMPINCCACVMRRAQIATFAKAMSGLGGSDIALRLLSLTTMPVENLLAPCYCAGGGVGHGIAPTDGKIMLVFMFYVRCNKISSLTCPILLLIHLSGVPCSIFFRKNIIQQFSIHLK
jgi:hypothetical protein